MNILISTTTNWNPGDDFIRYGVKNLLKNLYPNVIYIHYDTNPDYFKVDEWAMGSGHKSNTMNNPIDWSMINLVVLAGSPEFLHGPLRPIYEGLYEHRDIPLLAIGVGYSNEMSQLTLSLEEHMVLSRDNTCIITRQNDLQKELSDRLARTVYCLPCPALFAHERVDKKISALLIPQADKGNQSIDIKDQLDIDGSSNTLKDGYYSISKGDVDCIRKTYTIILEEFRESLAHEKAKRILLNADLHMSLEDQQVTTDLETRIQRLKEKLIKEGKVF